MKLYHFTDARNVDAIATYGLLPRVPRLRETSLGRPVVWLTAFDAMQHWTKKHPSVSEEKRRLTVRIPSNKQLVHYATWLQKQKSIIVDEQGEPCTLPNGELYSTDHLLAVLPATAKKNWYVYFGAIPVSRIEF
jgi:hypothetical protein